jgi:hypothetical protein
MRFRTLLILTVLLAVLAGAGVAVIRLNTPRSPDSAMGDYLLRDLPVNDIASIGIKGSSSQVRLEKKDGRWVVADRFGYPAEFSKIAEFVRALRNAKTGRRFEASEETLARMSLIDPYKEEIPESHKGIEVLLQTEAEKPLAHLVLGSPRSSETGASGGRYVKVKGSSEVYLIDATLAQYKPSPPEWLEKDLLDVPAPDVKELACTEGGNDIYRFERSEKESSLEPVVFPHREKIDRQAVDKLAGALASFRIEDVVPASQIDETTFGVCVEYRLFDGKKISLYPGMAGGENGEPVLRISVDMDRSTIASEGSGENASDKQLNEEAKNETTDLMERVSPWVFKLSRWRFDTLVTDPADLLVNEESPTS